MTSLHFRSNVNEADNDFSILQMAKCRPLDKANWSWYDCIWCAILGYVPGKRVDSALPKGQAVREGKVLLQANGNVPCMSMGRTALQEESHVLQGIRLRLWLLQTSQAVWRGRFDLPKDQGLSAWIVLRQIDDWAKGLSNVLKRRRCLQLAWQLVLQSQQLLCLWNWSEMQESSSYFKQVCNLNKSIITW